MEINIVELATDLTLSDKYFSADDIYEWDPDAMLLVLKEEPQEAFNEWYDYYYSIIEENEIK